MSKFSEFPEMVPFAGILTNWGFGPIDEKTVECIYCHRKYDFDMEWLTNNYLIKEENCSFRSSLKYCYGNQGVLNLWKTFENSNDEFGHLMEPKMMECKICWTKPRELLFLPCKHLVACVSCGINFNICPICRNPINHILKIYT